MSEMPDFEPTVPPVNEYPAPKKPKKKPTKKVKAKKAEEPKPRKVGRRRTGWARKSQVAAVKRRGRPVGSLGKPKLVVDTSTVAMIIGVHAQIEHALSQLSPAERKAMLEMLK